MNAIMETSLDDYGGILAEEIKPGAPLYDVRAIDAFCREHGIASSDLTDEQIEEFIVGYAPSK